MIELEHVEINIKVDRATYAKSVSSDQNDDTHIYEQYSSHRTNVFIVSRGIFDIRLKIEKERQFSNTSLRRCFTIRDVGYLYLHTLQNIRRYTVTTYVLFIRWISANLSLFYYFLCI